MYKSSALQWPATSAFEKERDIVTTAQKESMDRDEGVVTRVSGEGTTGQIGRGGGAKQWES